MLARRLAFFVLTLLCGALPIALFVLTLVFGTLPILSPATRGATTYPRGGIDNPPDGAVVSGATITIQGWAIDLGAAAGTGVDQVSIVVDGTPFGDAAYARDRADIGSAYASARFTPSGYLFLLDVGSVGPGQHRIEARARSTVSGVTTSYVRNVTVAASPAPVTAAEATESQLATGLAHALPPLAAANASPQMPAPMTAASRAKQFGINAHLTWYGGTRAAGDVQRAVDAGMQSIRFDIQWNRLEPSAKGRYALDYLAQVDAAMQSVTSRGLRPLVVLIGTPDWARGNAGSARTPPTRLEDYAETLAILASRYAGYAGLAVEVWNEPNQPKFWDTPSGPDPLAYARMLKASYAAVKAAAPSVAVVGGAIAFNDQAYVQGLFTFGGIAGSYDAFSLHPYGVGQAPDAPDAGYYSFSQAVENVAGLMAQVGDGERPIWITEMGWSTNAVSEDTRAAFFRRAVDMVRGWQQVEQFVAFDMNQTDGHPDVGLITPQGTPTPSWSAYVQAIADSAGSGTPDF